MTGADITVRSCRPDRLSVERLYGETTLVLGAPCVGTTDRLKELDNESDVRYVEDLSAEAIDEVSDALLIVDHLYESIVAAQSRELPIHERLSQVLHRDAGVCLATRPRTIDWMLRQDDSEVPVTAAELNAIEQVITLRYAPESDTDVDRCAERCTGLADDITEDDIRASLDLLRYEGYAFDHEVLDTTIGEYSPTLLPSLVGFVSAELGDAKSGNVLTGSAVLDALGEFGANVGIAETFSFIRTRLSQADLGAVRETELSDVLSAAWSGTGRVSPSIGVGVGSVTASAVPFGPLVGLGLWLALRDWDGGSGPPDALPVDELISRIADGTLTPPARERVEAALDLPPGTMDNLTWLGREQNLQRIRRACEKVPELRTEFEAAVEEWTGEFETELDDIAARVEHLAERTQRPSEFESLVSNELAGATRDLSAFERAVRSDERTLLTGGDWPDGTDEPTISDVGAVPYYGDEDDRIVEAVEDGGLVVLEGAHGTGKTMAALKAVRELNSPRYDVRLPDAWESPEYIEWAMDRIDGRSVLVTSYRVGTAPFDDRDLRQLLEWIQDGPCHAAIVEVREEFASAFRQQYESREFRTGSEVWRTRERIEFSELPVTDADGTDHSIVDVVMWVLRDVYELPPKQLSEAMIAVLDFAEENAEVAKLAARYIAVEDEPLSAVDTVDDLIWEDIDNIITPPGSEGRDLRARVFRLLSFARSLSLDDLAVLTGEDPGDLFDALADLFGYLDGEEMETLVGEGFETPDTAALWTVSPDIYTEVVFRRVGLRRERSKLQTFLLTLDNADSDVASTAYPGLALNLQVAYEVGRERGDDDLVEAAVAASEAVFEQVSDDAAREPGRLAIQRLTNVPIDPSLLRTHRDQVLQLAARSRFDQSVVLMNLFGSLLVAIDDRSHMANVVEVLDEYVAVAIERDLEWKIAEFLGNVYSVAIAMLAENHVPGEVDHWLNELEGRIAEVATDPRHEFMAGDFLTSVYPMTVKMLSEEYTPSEIDDWLNEFDERIADTATDPRHEFSPADFRANVYALVLWQWVVDCAPGEVVDWLDELDDRIADAATDPRHEFSAGTFCANVYALTVAKVADDYANDYAPGEVADWLDELDERVVDAATDSRHGLSASELRGDYTAIVLSEILSDAGSLVSDPWPRAVLNRATETLDRDELIYFYDYYLRYTVLPGTDVSVLADLLNRTRSGDPPCESWADQVELLAVVIARTHQMFVDIGVEFVHDDFQRLFTLIGALAPGDPNDFVAVVTRVVELLDGEPPPVELQDPSLPAPAARDAFVERAVAHGVAQATAADGREDIDDLFTLLADLVERTTDPEAIYVDCLRRAGGLDYADPQTAVVLIKAAIDRLNTDEVPLDRDTRIAAVAGVTAAVLERTPVGTEPEPPFDAVIGVVNELAENNAGLYRAMTVAVADELESSEHGFDIPTATAWREAFDIGN